MSPAARLEEMAERDPTVAPLAGLLALALRAAAEPSWEEGVPPLDPAQLRDGLPLLHGATLAVDEKRLGRLLRELGEAMDRFSPADEGGSLRAGAPGGSLLPVGERDPLGLSGEKPTPASLQRERKRGRDRVGQNRLGPAIARSLLEATIGQATDRVAELADRAGVEADRLAILGHAAALPLLQATGRRAAPLLDDLAWEAGYCPLCAAWPTLAELRGLERERWLRCGRCGAGWHFRPLCCPYCREDDYRRLGYLAPSGDRESRRAEHCDSCHGYLKSMTVLGPTRPDELSAEDLATVELDLAALERGYGRPQAPGFPLEVRVEARPTARRWLAWRR